MDWLGKETIMADFRTHITVSTLAGAAYGATGYFTEFAPLPSCVVAGTLCSVAGMLPDLDSDNSTPVREMLSFGAAVVPMALFSRLQAAHLSHEELLCIGLAGYLAIRFGVGELLSRFTVHRGMFHSIPALLIAFTVTFMMCHIGTLEVRLFKAGGVALGFLTHLVLDEIWAVRWGILGPRTKKSFGTALKFFGQSSIANTAAYAVLLFVGLLAYQDLTHPVDMRTMVINSEDSLIDRISSAFQDEVTR
jgi:membrane-bound metal-dependent hydrolase YbcI (DUF457 family)